ncbi:MAG: methylmalonyl Co-A mutase-associated GTPase MeaB [Prevotellaceae bacterium]|jgi:LAO/AO transport system kinase|nr:methylmalonyl Co-A mutase-associated GTPase MeaB [Prevotellaceae bacterium]
MTNPYYYDNHHHNTAPFVSVGVEPPPQVNPNVLARLKKPKTLSASDYVEGVASGNRMILGRAITMVESLLPAHRELAQEIVERCLPHSGKSVRVGITGVPGAGKSTFIEAIGSYLTGLGNKLAVLAIDPSSERSGGSILGDKTRMETLAGNPNAFIRPSPSAGSLGGVARKTRESILLCEAAGFDVIFVETVGVGQSETQVHSMVDCFLLLMLSGAGDELQGIKRGIMEMSDILAITKADGANADKATAARIQYQSALNLFPPHESGWKPTSLTCSAVDKTGLTEVWKNVLDYAALTKSNGYFDQKRREQTKYWMYEAIHEALRDRFYNNPQVKIALPKLEREVLEGKISSFAAARELLQI